LLMVQVTEQEGTSRVKFIERPRRVKVSADGRGVVSHAGTGMLRELAFDTGLVVGVSGALADTYAGPWVHAPGRVFADLAVAIADGGDCVSHIKVLGDRHQVVGPVASMPTTWRLLDRIDAEHLPRVRAARAAARARAWQAGVSPDLSGLLADRFRCHDHDCPFGEGERGQDLEEDLRHASVVGVAGPPGGLRRGRVGRVAPPGQCWVKHRR
jgi:hypothetical protein